MYLVQFPNRGSASTAVVSASSSSSRLLLLFLLTTTWCCCGFAGGTQHRPIYNNEFAVYIPLGKDVADRIATKHGFVNIGQIGSLKGYYLFEHQRVHKRSLEASDFFHKSLSVEPEVQWVQQQHERKRRKRDVDADFPLFANFFSSVAPSAKRTTTTNHGKPHSRSVGPFAFPDPLFKEQWYLNGGAKDGLDMNVGPAWGKGYTGKGVVVSILDDGIQTNHPDLAQNYDALASTDINGNDDDPMPQDNGDNKHGTRCAGEVAAVAYNQYCGIGVAYNASIGGVRMLDGVVNDAVEARALGLNPDHIDIYSASWGPEDDGKTVDGPGPLARRAFIYGVTSGRKGKGSIFVWASGNGGRHTDSCNCDGYTNSIFTLSISSATQGGYKPWYLEECSSTLATTYSSGTPGHDKSVASVDMDARLRADHICTVEHTGTSASAPIAAGICALALEANPTLTWRDMQYLVVLTSRAAPLEKDSGWVVNGVKRKISHKFGYGLMDAGAMVGLAERWTNVPPQHICKSAESLDDRAIDSGYGFTLTLHMDVTGCRGTLNEVQFLEHVQCKITLRFFPRGNLRVLLTSPMGTTSTLLFERPRDVVASNFDDWPFLSVHFWGEKAEGRWTLRVVNAGSRQVNQPGVLKKWQLVFYGTAVNPIRLRSPAANNAIPSIWKSPLGSNFAFPTEAGGGGGGGGGATPASTAAADDDFFGAAGVYKTFQNFPNAFSFAGSEPEQAYRTLGDRETDREGAAVGAADGARPTFADGCDPECDKQGCYGPGPTKCVACKRSRLDDACVRSCPPRSFADETGRCRPCHESCETCIGAGQDSCVSCASGHVRVVDLDVCMQQCPEGYFENAAARTCVPCGPHCRSCRDRPDRCATCDHHLLLHDHTCVALCPPSMYESDDYRCEPCHATCATCRGPNDTQCVSCPAGTFELDGGCSSECPDGRYGDVARNECVECPRGCVSCDADGCARCADGWRLDGETRACRPDGVGRCGAAEYFEGGRCAPCDDRCETCSGATHLDCLTCATPRLLQAGECVDVCGKGFYLEGGRCVRCLHTCVDCVSRPNCTECVAGLQLQNGRCLGACEAGYYSDLGRCVPCHLSCSTCMGPHAHQCVTCPPTWRLAAGRCRPSCPDGYYQTERGCRKCEEFCRNCIDGCKNQADKRRINMRAYLRASDGSDTFQFINPYNLVTTLAVIACVFGMALFTLIFVVLQRNSWASDGWKRGNYSKVSIKKPTVTCHYNVVSVDDSSSDDESTQSDIIGTKSRPKL